jgi:ferredoxin-NADP reductase
MGILTTTKLEFVAIKQEAGEVYSIRFRPLTAFAHTAGQHGFFLVPGGGLKPFSLASAPEDHEVVIGTQLHEGSRFKRALRALKPGAIITMRGPVFNFTLKKAAPRVVMLAQGTGITPFRSILRHIQAAKLTTRTTLIHVARGPHPFRGETEKLAQSALYPSDRSSFETAVRTAIAANPEATYFISGAGSFIGTTRKLLTANSIGKNQIRADRFIGYK